METININQSVFADISCKGGTALLIGIIVSETEKAIKIDYSLEPVFASGSSAVIMANRTAWIPKSQIIAKDGAFEIKGWFANKMMKSFNIKPYKI